MDAQEKYEAKTQEVVMLIKFFTKWDVLPQVQNGNDVFIMWGIYEKCMKPQIKVNVLLLIKMEEFDFL